uniref:ZFP-1 n=1 Tax=Schmidtea mediterranea TaxID=79327 RepID=H9CXV1_SCHMD|nr:ZFP-1 [Schmidtea mediterranea]
MNFMEQNNSLMKSFHQLLHSHWLNPLQVIPPVSTRYSSYSSSTASFISPGKSESSDQEEPLNLSLKYCDVQLSKSQNSPVPTNQFRLSSQIPLMIPHVFQTLFTSRPILPNIPKSHSMSGFFPLQMTTMNDCNKQKRKSTPVKLKKSRCFKCNQCRQIFPCLNNLTEHTLQVHGSYKCHICNTSFTQRSNLQRHALRHVGFKPYKCGVCSKEYYRKDHLIRHISFNHPMVSPKENIIQRLSSSESLNFIDSQEDSDAKLENEFSSFRPESDNSYHSYENNDDNNSIAEENIFLKVEPTDSMDVDILN